MVAEQDEHADPHPWRVVVFTNVPGGFVYKLVDEVVRPLGHRIVGVVTSPGPKRRRSTYYLDVVAAASPGVDVLVSNHPARWAAIVSAWQPDLIISGGMPWRIPEEVAAIPRLGAINMHPSLLPRHRGPGAIEWAFRSGDPETGFTIHRLAPEFDTGSILAQASIPIDDEDDFGSLMAKLRPMAPDLLREALERVARGDPGEPQDESQATYAGLFEEELRVIDWGQPARTIHNQVRSCIAFGGAAIGALGAINGESFVITKTRLLPPDHAPDGGVPGTMMHQDGEQMVVQCGDGPLEVLAWGRDESGLAGEVDQ
jgi:methionyl-tRNA formyltransferase